MNNAPRSSDAADTSNSMDPARPAERSITWRAILLGSLALLFIILSDDYNNFYLKQRSLNAGFLPPGPLFLVLSAAVLWNPMWKNRLFFLTAGPVFLILFTLWTEQLFPASWLRALPLLPCILFLGALSKSIWMKCSTYLQLSTRELIVALIIVLCGSWTGGAGLAEFHAYTHVVPWVKYETRLHQQEYETLDYVPQHLWPAGGLTRLKEQGDNAERKRVYDAFLTGSEAQGTQGVPWDAWQSSLLHWIPLIICLSTCFIALSLIVHQQWSKYEQLPYPLAKLTQSIFVKQQERTFPDIFYLTSFWIGFGIPATMYTVNLLHAWWPGNFPSINLNINLRFVYEMFPTLLKSGTHHVTNFKFLFSAVGICYFLSREIGLSLGLSKILLAILGAQVYLSTGTRLGHEEMSNATAGAYIIYAIVILYTGRTYYTSVCKKAFSRSPVTDEDSCSVWGARLLLISFIGLTLSLTWSFELDFPTAFLFGLLVLLAFLVFTRVICETGVPYLQIPWNPALLLTKMLGIGTVGAAPIVILHFINTAILMDAKNAMMPFVSNSLKLADDFHLKIKKLCILMFVIISVAVVFSLVSRLYQHYTFGSNIMQDGYGKNWVQNRFLDVSSEQLSDLDDNKLRTPAGVDAGSFWQRLQYFDPDNGTIINMVLGGAGVLLFFALRFRFTAFPLHPVLFLVWTTWPIGQTFYSFLIGWIIRELIIRYGGDHVYQKGKPFFIGLIIGELLLFIISSLCGMSYNVFTGELPPRGI